MEITSPPQPPKPAPGSYISLPPEVAPETKTFSPGFIVFAILLIVAAAVAGCLQSGKLSLNQYFNVPKPVVVAQAAPHPAAPIAVPPPKAGAFLITSISLGASSFAIINGKSRVQGDPVEAPGVTGWKVNQIVEGGVRLQNGATIVLVPVSEPGLKPLDDQLHPLN